MSERIFISYSAKDQKLANSVCDFLENKGLICFISSRDIAAGKNYMEELMNAIIDCKKMVLILTKESNTSQWVLNEIERAFNLKKPIILFRTQNIGLSKSLEVLFAAFNWLEAFENPPHVYFEKLYYSILDLPLPPLPSRVIISKKIIFNSLLLYTVITVLLFFLFGISILKDYKLVAHKNDLGISLFDKIRRSGLVDIDDKLSNPSPPRYFYQSAKKEIVIAGALNRYTMENDISALDSALQRGVKIKFLCLNPTSSDTAVIHTMNNRALVFSNEFETLIRTMNENPSVFKNSNFSIRFMDHLPSIIGIMTDGDVENMNDPHDDNGMIRIVPYLRSEKHVDWVFQFYKDPFQKNRCAFDDYAREFRNIWKQSKPHPEYFL